MSAERRPDEEGSDAPQSDHDILLRMDLATEVLEGLDELGLDTREEVLALLSRLERQVGDAP